MKPLVLTQHAWDAIDERKIDPEWMERVVRGPDWVVADPSRFGVERRIRAIPEYGKRVACYETSDQIRRLTMFFDRDARRP